MLFKLSTNPLNIANTPHYVNLILKSSLPVPPKTDPGCICIVFLVEAARAPDNTVCFRGGYIFFAYFTGSRRSVEVKEGVKISVTLGHLIVMCKIVKLAIFF
jgi:hypothetical protein